MIAKSKIYNIPISDSYTRRRGSYVYLEEDDGTYFEVYFKGIYPINNVRYEQYIEFDDGNVTVSLQNDLFTLKDFLKRYGT